MVQPGSLIDELSKNTGGDSFGPTDYGKLMDLLGNKSFGESYEKSISVTAGSTEQHDLDFPLSKATLIYISVVAESGTTDCDLSIHESTTYDLTDQVFRAVEISINDNQPTGGRPSTGSIPYGEENGNSTLHVKTTENSGNDGSLLLKIRYLEV